MLRLTITISVSLIIIISGCSRSVLDVGIAPADATGVVFNDLNNNGIRDAHEPGIRGVRVSNGTDIVLTDNKGRYALDVTDDTIIFVIKPAGWMTKTNKVNLPQFYYIHKPNGSPALEYPAIAPTGPQPESIDFALYEHPESEQFDVVIFGDPQVGRKKELTYLAHDAVDEVAGIDAAFGVTLGDIVFDNIGDFQAVNQVISAVGLDWYNLPGNHDMNFDAAGDNGSLETYKSIYGPAYYSFDYSNAHFIVLDTIISYKGHNNRLEYDEGLEEKQIQFVKNDLTFVGTDKLIVLLMHAPETSFGRGRPELFEMIGKYPHTLSVAGHDHRTESIFLGDNLDWHRKQPHHLYIAGAVSGAWWTGAHDERGIPHATMTNGVPNGYSVISFNDNKYRIRFKALGRPADYQMSIWAPDVIGRQDLSTAEVVANVFAVSNKAKVHMRLGESGKWILMENVIRQDPYFIQVRKWETANNVRRVSWSENPSESSHIWRGDLPENVPKGTHFIYVKAQDLFGQTHTGRRLITIE